MFLQRKVGPLRPYLGGVQGLLFKCSVGDDSLRAEVGDVGVDVFDKRKCFVVWKLLIGVSVGKMRRGSFQVVILGLDDHLVPFVCLVDDQQAVSRE